MARPIISNLGGTARALGAGVAILIVFVVTSVNYFRFRAIPFDGARWRAQTSERGPRDPRNRMVADVLQHILKTGMSSQSVIAILGTPDQHITGTEYQASKGTWYMPDGASGDELLAYVVVDDPPLPQSYTTYLRILFKDNRMVVAWKSDEP